MEKIKLLIKRIIPISLYIYIQKERNIRNIRKLSKESKISILDIEELKKLKKSDTLFILGGGSSINSITEKEWKVIKTKDSFGLNFWLYHEFVPDFYCYEEPFFKEIFYKTLKLKEKEYENTIFILKDGKLSHELVPEQLKKNYRLSLQLSALISSKKEMIKFYKKVENLKMIVQARVSMSYLIYLGYLMGYEKVVLCGVELDNTKYFYQEKKYNHFEIPQIKKTEVHITEEQRNGVIITSEIIKILSKNILKDKLKIYIAKNVGKLKNEIEVYDFEKENSNKNVRE